MAAILLTSNHDALQLEDPGIECKPGDLLYWFSYGNCSVPSWLLWL